MNYIEIKPNKFLSRYIKCYWMLEGKSHSGYEESDRVLPDGCIELIINFKEPFQEFTGNKNFETQAKTFVVGQIKNYKLLKPSNDFSMLGIRFNPTGAYNFFNFPLSELTSQTVDAEIILGNEIKELREKMLYSNQFQKINLLEKFLMQNFKVPAANKNLHALLVSFEKEISRFTVTELSAKLGLSNRQVERNFSKYIGLTPKSFLKIKRLQNVLKHIQKNNTVDWITLSYISGYYDQSHFVNDFRDFSGMNPSEYLSSNEQLVEFFINR